MPPPVNVFFFGDSVCFGQGVSLHSGWVGRISASLEEVGGRLGREAVVSNCGVNGNTTRLALERMHHDVLAHRCDILLIQFGMNDCNYWETEKGVPRVSPRAFVANLHEMLDRALVFGVGRIFLNTNHPTARYGFMPPSEVRYQDSNDAYNRLIREVARERPEVALIDVDARFREELRKGDRRINDFVLPEPDLVHLSVRGHELYASLITPLIVRAVFEIVGPTT